MAAGIASVGAPVNGCAEGGGGYDDGAGGGGGAANDAPTGFEVSMRACGGFASPSSSTDGAGARFSGADRFPGTGIAVAVPAGPSPRAAAAGAAETAAPAARVSRSAPLPGTTPSTRSTHASGSGARAPGMPTTMRSGEGRTRSTHVNESRPDSATCPSAVSAATSASPSTRTATLSLPRPANMARSGTSSGSLLATMPASLRARARPLPGLADRTRPISCSSTGC